MAPRAARRQRPRRNRKNDRTLVWIVGLAASAEVALQAVIAAADGKLRDVVILFVGAIGIFVIALLVERFKGRGSE